MSGVAHRRDPAYWSVRERLLQACAADKKLSHRTLAAELGIGLGTVRKVLQQLENEGLLEARPRSGIRLRQVEATEYHEIYDLRELIEPYAARRAAWWMPAEQVDELFRCCDDYEREIEWLGTRTERFETELRRLMRIEHRYHGLILEGARNRTTARLLDQLRMLDYTAFYAEHSRPERCLEVSPRVCAEHRTIATAIRAGAADDAERFMKQHLRLGRNRTLAGLPPAELRELEFH